MRSVSWLHSRVTAPASNKIANEISSDYSVDNIDESFNLIKNILISSHVDVDETEKLNPHFITSAKAQRTNGSKELENILSQNWIHRVHFGLRNGLNFRHREMKWVGEIIAG